MIFKDFRYQLIVFISFLMFGAPVKSDDELCQNTIVYSVDRFNNKTVRLFRQNDFWDLNGFPDKVSVGPKGSMKEYQFFGPVNKTAKIVTVVEGSSAIKDRTYKFDGLFWWSWYNHPKFGLRYVSTSAGLYWDEIPKDHGFDSVFHNGDQNDPMLIGLESDSRFSDKYMKIHYFSTQNETFVRKTSKYFDEKDFPKDLTDAFSWPPTKGLKYMVYILKADKYCILSDKQKCTEWKSLRELIRCSEQTKPVPSSPQAVTKPSDRPTEGREPSVGRTSIETGLIQSEGPSEVTNPSVDKSAPPLKPIGGGEEAIVAPGNENENNSTTEGGGAQTIAFSVLSMFASFLCFIFL